MIAWLLALAVFAGLSMNLVLQLGIGMREIAFDEKRVPTAGAAPSGIGLRLCAFFASVMVLWLAFSSARSLLPLGFLEYVLVFPASFLFFSARDRFARLFMPRLIGAGGVLWRDAAGDGAFAGAALFVMLSVAGGFLDAAALSLGFAAGALLAAAIVSEIKKRAEMEAVPRRLRGAPLALVAMGLLSLVFSSVAMMFFDVLGNG